MGNEHLTATRAWHLVRDNLKLDPSETIHLDQCDSCCDWMQRFYQMAKRAGFKLSVEIPEKKSKAAGDHD